MLIQKLSKICPISSGTLSARLLCTQKTDPRHSAAAAAVQRDEHLPAEHHEEGAIPATKFEWNGRTYNYPWKGAWKEDFSPELWSRMIRDGAITRTGRLKPWKIKDKTERQKVLQLWYQKDDGLHVWQRGYADTSFNRFLLIAMVFVTLTVGVNSYLLTTPKEENIFEPSNWKRWHNESHD